MLLKMAWLNEAFGGKFPMEISLAIIAVLIGVSIAASLLVKRGVSAPVRSS
jgi:tellurite resistance protein TerC